MSETNAHAVTYTRTISPTHSADAIPGEGVTHSSSERNQARQVSCYVWNFETGDSRSYSFI